MATDAAAEVASCLTDNSFANNWVAHALWVVPPLIGLLWTIVQWVHVSGLEPDVKKPTDADDTDSSGDEEHLTGAIFDIRQVHDPTDKMSRLAGIIAKGAETFLFTEYMYMGAYVVGFSILLLVFYLLVLNENAAIGYGTTAAFVIGAVTSIICGYIGMMAAVMSNVRTTYACWQHGIADGLDVSMRGGSIMGFGLCSIGVLTMYILVMCFQATFGCNKTVDLCEALAGFGLGGSSIALFGRVGGGIYTKAADVGADLSGKNNYNMEEDDPRNPACIADNVGDNVGDIAGMGADLFGSFAEATVAALVIAAKGVPTPTVPSLADKFTSLYFPVLISSSGILVGVVTMVLVIALIPKFTKDGEDMAGIENTLKFSLIISTLLQTPVVIGLALYTLPEKFMLPFGEATAWGAITCILVGLWVGLIIGLVTEYYTSNTYHPVKELAETQKRSAATGIIYGLALGYLSCIIPVILLVVVVVVASNLAGMYGVALGALGMLSTLTIGLTIDAYGPISDNAGGIAEMAGLPPDVREKTDALDAAGNTTAAVGKGFAIGSAALVGLALFGAFKARAEISAVDVSEAWTFAGLLIGALLPYWFSAMTMKSVGMAAQDMVDECMKQFPDIVAGKAAPDYESCISISTRASLNEMILPGLLVILSPLVMGGLFGKKCCAGLLSGALVSGVQLAISMSNSGGAWDNSKKFIKGPDCGMQKDTEEWKQAHANSVTGDTVGDPLKDTSGPSLNILIKLSAITSLVFAPIIREFSNPQGGPKWSSA
eukprot:TRINITY_DN315_c0_g3_i1.p1 TRINITY_DN315_c0_g3~~TRINITY_DN315_c0_g3_i1.p1  ORF type:complete len:772 (-),score=172.69 TRINITY_DN315_c0_g3_i1:509-2824(-)